MKKGDFYFRPGNLEAPCGVVTKPEKVIQKEFATYKIVYYKPCPSCSNHYDLIRVTEGPDLFLVVIIEHYSQYEFTLNDKWESVLGATVRFDCNPEGFFNALIDLSEKELGLLFNQAFQVV